MGIFPSNSSSSYKKRPLFLRRQKLNEFQFGDFYCFSFWPFFDRYRFNRFPDRFFREKSPRKNPKRMPTWLRRKKWVSPSTYLFLKMASIFFQFYFDQAPLHLEDVSVLSFAHSGFFRFRDVSRTKRQKKETPYPLSRKGLDQIFLSARQIVYCIIVAIILAP